MNGVVLINYGVGLGLRLVVGYSTFYGTGRPLAADKPKHQLMIPFEQAAVLRGEARGGHGFPVSQRSGLH